MFSRNNIVAVLFIQMKKVISQDMSRYVSTRISRLLIQLRYKSTKLLKEKKDERKKKEEKGDD